MKGTDKTLLVIVAGVMGLMVLGFALAFLRPRPTYHGDDTPEDITHNYLLALRQKDYARAYDYLSPALAGYPPSLERFTAMVETHSWEFGQDNDNVSLQVLSSQPEGERVVVTVRKTTFYRSGLFDSSQDSSTFTLTVEQAPSGAWKIIHGDYYYWDRCWESNDCP